MRRITKKVIRHLQILYALLLIITLFLATHVLWKQEAGLAPSFLSTLSKPNSEESWTPTTNEEVQETSIEEQPTLNQHFIESYPHYHIKASLDEQQFLIRGNLELKMKNPGTEQILFYAYPYAWAPMKIMAVKLNNHAVPYEFDGSNVTFNNQVEAEDLEIIIQFETPIPQAGTRFGVKDNVWLITTWYPMLGVLDDQKKWIKRPNPRGMGDPFYFRFANYTVEWTSDAAIKWVSSGSLDSEETQSNQQKTTWKVDQVRNFALVGSPDYIIKRIQLNDRTTISLAVTEEENLAKVENIARYTYPLYTKIYGPLPYSDVAIAETSYQTNYALEYPNLAIFSKDMYVEDKIQHWIPHEVGHTWWYNAVGVDETVDGWLDEGMVEHGVVWYLEERFSKERAQATWDQFRSEHQELIKNYPNSKMDVGLYGYQNFTEYDYSWYSRSADMFLTLRQALGNEKYVQFLNVLYSDNVGKIVNEDSLNQALADSLGLQTDFFQQWIHEPYSQTSWEIHFTVIENNN